MARYIDADALVKDLKEQYEEVFGGIKKKVRPEDFFIERNSAYYANIVEEELNSLFDYLKKIPTADVVEVRHGEWKWDERFSDYRCSVCSSWDLRTSNFCSNCGADMRGDKSDV